MASPSTSRNRGVRATPEAIQLIEAKLQEGWGTAFGKLTHRRKAEILHLNERTADKLLTGGRVDRSTVAEALHRLGIEWNDEFLVKEIFEQSQEEKASPAKPRRFSFVMAACVVIVGFAIVAALQKRPSPAPPTTWRKECFARLAEGTRLYNAGKYEDAAKEFDAAEKLARANHDAGTLAEPIRMKGDIDMVYGRFQEAAGHYKQALELKEQGGSVVTYPAIQEALGIAYLKQGKLKEAKEMLLRALTGWASQTDSSGFAMAQRDFGAVSYAEGDYVAALAWFASSRASVSDTPMLMDVRSQEALALSRLGKHTEAKQRLQECLAFWQRERHPRWIAVTQFRFAQSEIAAGNHDEAARHLEQSIAGYESLGDVFGLSQAKELLASLRSKKP